MDKTILLLTTVFLGSSLAAYSQTPTGATNQVDKGVEYLHDFKTDYSFTAGGSTKFAGGRFGDLSDHSLRVNYDLGIKTSKANAWRLGAGWSQYWLDVPTGIPLPHVMQSATLRFGNRYKLNETWAFQASIEPGFYHDGHDWDSSDLNAPFWIGMEYAQNARVTWMMGIRVNVWSDIPVIPGVGVRWKFADQWTLNLSFPKPELRYSVNDALSLFVGGQYRGGSYRIRDDFTHAPARGEILDFREMHAGGGISYRFCDNFSMEFFGGYAFYRRFDFDDIDQEIRAKAAPTASLSLNIKF